MKLLYGSYNIVSLLSLRWAATGHLGASSGWLWPMAWMAVTEYLVDGVLGQRISWGEQREV
jgi:hypothetical protein